VIDERYQILVSSVQKEVGVVSVEKFCKYQNESWFCQPDVLFGFVGLQGRPVVLERYMVRLFDGETLQTQHIFHRLSILG
jgi:hypothetical protein